MGPVVGGARLWPRRLPRHRRTTRWRAFVRHPAAAAQRDRHAAHGPRVQPDHHGQPDALPPHARASTRSGYRAPTTRASPRRSWWSASCRSKASRAMTWAAEAFVAKVWEWKEKSGNTITTQMRRMGDSVDWSREYFTMDAKLSEVVTETFVRLYQQGLIYRGKRLVNWDPELKTAVSDLEVESEEEDGFLWHIRYPLADGSGAPHVATTRPETMLGDVAVMVHPRGRALPAPDRQDGEAAAVRPRHPCDCRRLRGPGIRHRRGQGHAGPRRQRLRGGPAPRPAHHRRADAGREDQRQRARRLPRAGPLRGAQARGGRPASPGPARRNRASTS